VKETLEKLEALEGDDLRELARNYVDWLADEIELAFLDLEPETAGELEACGWEAWYSRMFGKQFVAILAKHHRESIEWHWDARMAQRRGEKPEYLSDFPIWSREHMKSTVARRMAVCDACLSVSEAIEEEERRGGYNLYVSRNKEMVKKHALSIEKLLTSEPVKKFYPKLARVKRNELGSSKGWQATFLNTEANYIFHFASLEEGLAGGNVEDWRPTFICLDDIDGREDSPVISEKRFITVTTEILPMAQSGTLVFFAQNYISRYSVMYRIHKGHSRVLTDRRPSKPVPAVIGLKTEQRVVGEVIRDVIVAGEYTWPLFGKEECQDRINREGLPAFLKERQHEVEQDREGLALQHYDDSVHVISRSEFARMYGTRDIPQRWYKYVFNDWARTKTQFHANVAGIIAVSGHESRLPGSVFLFSPMSFPASTPPEDVAKRILTTITPTVKVNNRDVSWDELVKITLGKTDLEKFITDAAALRDYKRNILAKVIPSYISPIIAAQNYLKFRLSHERTDVKKVYRDVFGLPFDGVNPGMDGGLDTINLLMRVDYKTPHAFRPGQQGFTNFYIVVEDGADALPAPFNEALSPDSLHDADLCRYQFKNWRFRDAHLTVAGEKEGELLKMNDDFGNGLMMLFHDRVVFASGLTKMEEVLDSLPEKVKMEAIEQIDDPQAKANRLAARQLLIKRETERVNKPRTRNVMQKLRNKLNQG
jgi:hypothetical protein